MTEAMTVTTELIKSWADERAGPVALYLKQKLVPVEGEGGVIFPPTYADIGYNIDELADGTKVVTIDSVGSQANRMEPIFKDPPYADLVPQIEIEVHTKEEGGEKHVEKRSLLDYSHRSADAGVLSCPSLAPDIAKAFQALKRRADAGPLCRLAPTSLVFGVWDSRGGSGEKRPRLVRSVIRAWNIQPLTAAAQFNSVWKVLDDAQREALEKEAKAKRLKLSEKGFADAPATFRKVNQSAAKHMLEFKDGNPNPDRRVLGGVIAGGSIERDVTVNLIALRSLRGVNEEETRDIRRYLLGLTLIAATADMELFLREGCHLRFADEEIWQAIPRRGQPVAVDLTTTAAQELLVRFAQDAVQPFRKAWPKQLVHKFDLKEAKKLLARQTEEEQSEAS